MQLSHQLFLSESMGGWRSKNHIWSKCQNCAKSNKRCTAQTITNRKILQKPKFQYIQIKIHICFSLSLSRFGITFCFVHVTIFCCSEISVWYNFTFWAVGFLVKSNLTSLKFSHEKYLQIYFGMMSTDLLGTLGAPIDLQETWSVSQSRGVFYVSLWLWL